MQPIFWIAVVFVAYGYFFYPVVIRLLAFLAPHRGKVKLTNEIPSVCILICAYNEQNVIQKKIENTLALDYPDGKKEIIIVSDGSTDQTKEICECYSSQIEHLWKPEREGKSKAQNRAMRHIQSDIVLFSDANSFLSPDALIKLAPYFKDPEVGGVCGEKKVLSSTGQTSGEGFYWFYESWLKKYDSRFYSVAGAPGEIFAIRRKLYEYPGDNALIEDFVLSLKIAMAGYRILYAPDITAQEEGLSWHDDFLRRRRIAAGGFQSIIWLKDLLNPFKYGRLSFIYISHRVLRWAVIPFLFPALFILNAFIYLQSRESIYAVLFLLQLCFYFCVFVKWKWDVKNVFCRLCFTVFLLNVSAWAGLWRFLLKRQSVLWEKPRV